MKFQAPNPGGQIHKISYRDAQTLMMFSVDKDSNLIIINEDKSLSRLLDIYLSTNFNIQ